VASLTPFLKESNFNKDLKDINIGRNNSEKRRKMRF
tara:strand:+ start:246 stop:353 length:108 start_codon:yes stop_codon:yes gene_type:complete